LRDDCQTHERKGHKWPPNLLIYNDLYRAVTNPHYRADHARA
jgi:hypothetical protein